MAHGWLRARSPGERPIPATCTPSKWKACVRSSRCLAHALASFTGEIIRATRSKVSSGSAISQSMASLVGQIRNTNFERSVSSRAEGKTSSIKRRMASDHKPSRG